jgi:hypothetical protein
VGAILAIVGISAFLYFGFIGYLPTPMQVRTDISNQTLLAGSGSLQRPGDPRGALKTEE